MQISQASQPNAGRLLSRALRAHEHGDPEKAERLYRAVLAREPNNFDALHGLGQIAYRRGRLAAALAHFQAALKNDLGRADGFADLGLVFHTLGQFERAKTSYDEGLRLAPENAELLNRRGVAFLELGRPREALDDFDSALAADPEHIDALGNRGNALFRLNQPLAALECYDRVLQRKPGDAALLTNRAIALRQLDQPHEALLSAARAIATCPDFAPARFVDSTIRLSLGDFAAGWRGYEWRWNGSMAQQRRKFSAPLWLGGQSLEGKTILLHAEQGFGDTLQFIRYAPLVAARGARIVLEVQPQLMRLLSRMPAITAVLPRHAPLPHFDLHCPLLSLPLALGTELETIPGDVPYIEPPADEVRCWRAELPRGRPLVGLVWSGERSHDNDVNRSIPLETLAPVLDEGADLQFVSLQHDLRPADAPFLNARGDVLQLGRRFADFADTAAVIANLDAVIAVDTAVGHLAGAMGKPLFLLLPLAADFRWLRARSDSPWYPSARLVRQPRFGDWQAVVEMVIAALTNARFVLSRPNCRAPRADAKIPEDCRQPARLRAS